MYFRSELYHPSIPKNYQRYGACGLSYSDAHLGLSRMRSFSFFLEGKSFHLLSNHEIVDRIVEYDPMFRIVAPLTVLSSS